MDNPSISSLNVRIDGLVDSIITDLRQIKTLDTEMPETEKEYGGKNTIPVPQIEEYNDFNTWLQCVEAWSETTELNKDKQGYILANELPIRSEKYGKTLREDLYRQLPPNKLINNKNGVKEVTDFLKGRFYTNPHRELYTTHKEFLELRRKKGQSISDFVTEYDNMYNKTKALNIHIEKDMLLALNLIATAELSETDYTIIMSVAELSKDDKKRYENIKQKMRDIFGGNINKKDPQEDIFLTGNKSENEDDISKQEEAFLARGWKPPKRNGKYQNNRYNNSRYQNNRYNKSAHSGASDEKKSFYKTKPQNPLGPDGKPLKCKGCKAITHFLKDCPDAYEHKKSYGKPKKYHTAYMVNEQTKVEEKVLVEVISETDTEEEPEDSVYCTDNLEDLNSFTAEALNKAALDTCCTSSVAGEKWTSIYLQSLSKDLRKQVEGPSESQKSFVFGNQGKLKSIAKYTIPVKIGGELNFIKLDVINSDIPLLLSKSEMKRIGITLDMKNDKGYINDKPLLLTTTTAGHYTVDLMNSTEEIEEVNIAELNDNSDTEQMKALTKIHKQFGHRPKRQFVTILKEAGKWQDKFSPMIDEMMNKCEGCILRKRTPDKPAVAAPMASDFGQVLGMDLKVWDKDKGIYILYFIDIFTRYQVATVVKSKEASEIVKAFTLKWLPIFGRINRILTDNGTEFSNEEMREVASQLDIKLDTTGAYSPWQNGIVERNHYSTDVIIHSVMRDYPKMKLEVALAWAVTAVNGMTNVRGFSPYQLVFGKQMKLPNILEDPPPAWEEPERSKTLLDTLQAIHATREAYIKAERCDRIKRALRAKIRIADTIYENGDLVYFKKETENTWRGPAKVVFQDSKVLFLRIGAIYYRVSANRVIKASDELAADIKNKEQEDTPQTNEDPINRQQPHDTRQNRGKSQKDIDDALEDGHPRKQRRNGTVENTANETVIDVEPMITDEHENDTEETPTLNEEQRNEPTEKHSKKGRKRRKTNLKPTPELNEDGTLKNAAQVLKRHDRIEIRDNGKWEKGVILGHGGKVTGKHAGWYNFKLNNGQVFHDRAINRDIRLDNAEEAEEDEVFFTIKLDLGKTILVNSAEQRIRLENEEESLCLVVEEDILAVMVPKEQRNSQECIAAKMEELAKLEAFETYTVVDDEGQNHITTTWVLTEKGKDVRARLTARGFQEDGDFPTDSPTVQKHSLKLLLAFAATNQWEIRTTDISSAFLQGSQMDREVFIKPPKEANMPGKLWKLTKCLYGLKDASRKWYMRVLSKLKDLDFKKSAHDKGLFYLFLDGELIGMVALHVDDFLHSGTEYFTKTIMPQLLSVFKIGKLECKQFMYTGFYINQSEDGITLDQTKYVDNITMPDINTKNLTDKKREMTQDELTLIRQITGMINWAARATRPELCFHMVDLSTKFKGGKVEDLIAAKNALIRLKKSNVTLKLSNLDSLNDCQIWVYTDAAFRNLNDKTDSCGGYIIFLVNIKNGKCAPIEWKSNKVKRKVHSTLAAETLVLYTGLDAAVAVKLMIQELTGGKNNLIVKAITDNKSARDAVYSESEVAERCLRADVAMIKDMIEDERVAEIKWIKGDDMLADLLTKNGVSKIPLINVLEAGMLPHSALRHINN